MDKGIPLARLLTADRLVIGLTAESYREAVDRLLDRLDAAGILKQREAVAELVEAEVAGGELPTIGDRALLAHYRTDAVNELALAIGTSEEPFAFAPSKAPNARILVLIVAPRSAARYYLKLVGNLSRLLREPELADRVADAERPRDILELSALKEMSIQPEFTVGDLMSREVNSVSPETPLSEVLRLLVRRGRRAVPVVSDTGEVLGLITEQEILQHFLPQLVGAAVRTGEERPLEDVEVRDVMQRSVLCLSEDQLISDVVGIMQSKNVPRFPVAREGVLVGFLSRTDLIRKLLDISV